MSAPPKTNLLATLAKECHQTGKAAKLSKRS